ncbi:MAG: hypothetical protein ACJ8ER_11910 [Allosphingosinicella sp.]
MIGLLMMAAAAQAPVQLARNDEAQWRLFVRASLETRPTRPSAHSRVRELEDALRGLSDTQGGIDGPKGL